MPSYFYHLKFELYPRPSPPTGAHDQSELKLSHATHEGSYESQRQRQQIWVPTPGTDIFDSRSWPRHAPVEHEGGGEHGRRKRKGSSRGKAGQQQQQQAGVVVSSGGGVIDCGPSRAGAAGDSNEIEARIAGRAGLQQLQQVGGFSAERAVRRDQKVAARDWRFGRVRVESVDMVSADTKPGVKRGESSSGEVQRDTGGINAGLAAGASVGRVTKARYEALEGKNTEVGWGIVHLYRDGEETPGLGDGGVEVYDAEQNVAASGMAMASGALEGQDGGVEEGENCTTLCIPAVPSYLTPSDFLGFVGEKTREEVSHFRMVTTGRMNRYLVLMKFRDGGAARRWRAEWDGKVFNSMEPETCHVTFIKSITFQTPTSSRSNTSFPELSHDPFTPSTSASAFLKPFPPPTPNLVELPTCPVCLERMDDTTGLLTILCQHVFHCACLQKWRGSGCPVCRHTNPSLSLSGQSPTSAAYDHGNPPFGSGEASLCSVCDCTDDLWICLICGNVGCGRYKGGHAKEHWKDSAHNFSLEIETQHVWDYAGDMWVHRLIRDKGDSKVIELPSSSRTGLGSGRGDHGDMDMVPREKLERIGMEYTHLLTSQLESQRVYFEDLVGKAVAKASAASSTAATAMSRAEESISKLAELQIEHRRLRDEVLVGLEKDLAREKKKAEKSGEVARGFGKSLMEEKKVSEGLMKRIGHVNTSMMAMSKELSLVKEENADLKEQNRDLLFSITAQQKLKDMEQEEGGLEAGELEGGTLSLPPEKRKGKGKGRGK